MKKNGYTLIELSIVLVIIGLIIGGIVVGRTLIRSAEIRAITSEYATYKQAIETFRDKYNALPGDFAGASTMWSGTTNGDGNGLIVTNMADTRPDEQFLAWQHLAKAELIKGSFTGVSGPNGTRDRVPGSNIPESSLSGAGWGLISITLTDIASGYNIITYNAPDLPPNHVLWIGGRPESGGSDVQSPSLTTTEAFNIDTKFDDGVARTGKIIAPTDTMKYPCNPSGTYNLTDSNVNCSLIFKTGY